MKKIKIFFLFVLPIFLISCSTFENSTIYDHPVRYFTSTIMNADRYFITLSNQTVWETDQLSTFANLSPVLIVLDENVNVGEMYVGNMKYKIHGGNSDDFFYRTGYLQIMQSYDSTKYVITLLNNTKWEIPKQFNQFVKKWAYGSEVIITEDKNFMINARRREQVPVRQIHLHKKN